MFSQKPLCVRHCVRDCKGKTKCLSKNIFQVSCNRFLPCSTAPAAGMLQSPKGLNQQLPSWSLCSSFGLKICVEVALLLLTRVGTFRPGPWGYCDSQIWSLFTKLLSRFVSSIGTFLSSAAAAAKLLQLCLTLCNPIDSSC